MTILNSELYDALLDGGTSDAKARAAAQSVAAYDNRFTKLDQDIAKLQSDMALLRWMIGGLYVLLIPMLIKLFIK